MDNQIFVAVFGAFIVSRLEKKLIDETESKIKLRKFWNC